MNKQKYYDLKAKRATTLAEAQALLGKEDKVGFDAKMAEVKAMNGDIDNYELLIAESGRFEDSNHKMVSLSEKKAANLEEMKLQRDLDGIRGCNEYAKSFVQAMKMGATPKNATGEQFNALFAAKSLTVGGGSPVGSDGGFLVPVEFDNMIHEIEKDYFDFSTLFHVEPVTAPTGWRAVAGNTATALPVIGEGAAIGKVNQPSFAQVSYSVKKYADRLQISKELLDDNTANLLAYLARWFAPKYILTKNTLLLGLLDDITAVSLTAGNEVADLKTATIKQLNTAAARRATYVTNQGGFAVMQNWVDGMGRPMLVPNPADPDCQRFGSRPVQYADDDLIADVTGGYPLFVGDFSQVGTLFVRKGIEVATTNVGGDAWANDLSEMRLLCRLDAKLMNGAAVYQTVLTEPVEEVVEEDDSDDTDL